MFDSRMDDKVRGHENAIAQIKTLRELKSKMWFLKHDEMQRPSVGMAYIVGVEDAITLVEEALKAL